MTKRAWIGSIALALAGVALAEAALRQRHRWSARQQRPLGLRPQSQEADEERRSWDLRVVALGDSNTYGPGLPYEATFPALLEARLRSLGRSARVWNAGINGQTVLQGLERLERDVMQRQPNLVLVAFGLNDCNLRRWPADDERERRLFPHGLGGWLGQLHLARTVTWRTRRLFRKVRRAQQGEGNLVPREEPRVHPLYFRLGLIRLVKEVRRRTGARVCLLTTSPVRRGARSDLPPLQQARQWETYWRYNALIRLAAWECGAALVDLEHSLAGSLEEDGLEADGVHLTAEGHARVADAIWQVWQELGLV